ncbi:MAG: Uncharacterized protein AUREO_003130 [Aureobasidium pullulans]|nr:MAG: Uncharacterized protein AUREO_003130 [Aureobasidium pullulans]
MSSANPFSNINTDVEFVWLWCDDNATVNKWFINIPNSGHYQCFYASLINACNRAYVKSLDPSQKLQKLDHLMVDCLMEDPIPADMMINLLKKYDHFIGGGQAGYKRKGLVKFDEDIPEMSAIEAGVDELYRLIEASCHKSRTGKVNAKINGKQHTSMDDDDEMHGEQSLLSPKELNDTSSATATATATATPAKYQHKMKTPVKFGELAVVGGRRGNKDEDEDVDMDMGAN